MKVYRLLWVVTGLAAGSVLANGGPVVANPSPWFEPNVGQAPGGVRFIARARGYSVAFDGNGSAAYAPGARADGANPVIWMRFVGARRSPEAAGEGSLPGVTRYYSGAANESGREARHYAAIRYREVYPGIDLRWRSREEHIEYEFRLAPGVDPKTIRIRFSGGHGVRMDENGDLVVATGSGALRYRRPEAWQAVEGRLTPVQVQFRIESGAVGFATGPYDPGRELIIDPVLLYSTYLGGSGYDAACAVAADAAGNTYVTGSTGSFDFPGSGFAGTVRRTYAVFITKLSANGSQVLYTVILASTGNDTGRAVALDGSGNVWVAGIAGGAGFPVTSNALYGSFGGAQDAFVARIDSTGHLAYATYLGGSGVDAAMGIAVDTSGAVYVAGYTASVNFPTTYGAPQTSFRGGFSDAFLLKLNSAGTALLYSTLLGGTGTDTAASVAVDANGDACIAGSTDSPNLSTNSALQASLAGNNDVLLACLNPSGTAWNFVTYLGGSGPDEANGIALNSAGDIYLTGDTFSPNFPVTAGAYQKTSRGNYDAFVMKLNPAGSAILFSTYLGGSGSDSGTAIAVDTAGNAWIGGYTASVDFPATDGSTFHGYYDCFIGQVRADGAALMSASYVGGGGDDRCLGVTLAGVGKIVFVGYTGSPDFPATSGALQSSPPPGYNAFVVSNQIPVIAPPASAAFVKTDSTAQGTWKGVYGADGSAIANDSANYPSYAQVALSGQSAATWANSTSDLRALQKYAGADRIASTWWAWSSFNIDVNITDGNMHQVALYCLDWDYDGRSERIDVLDAVSGNVLDSRAISGFTTGVYLVWNIGGHIIFRVTLTGPANAVVSGIFFGGAAATGPASTTFLRSDATTEGAWKTAYGAGGSIVVNDSAHYPGYAQVAVSGQSATTWASSTSDLRALQKYAAADRIASTWWAWSSFNIDVNITDGNTHQVALYCLDWDYDGRSERIDVLDAVSGSVLDSRAISGFTNGVYLVWNIGGHVTFRVTLTGPGNAVVSGVFFGGAAATGGASTTFLRSDATTEGTWKTAYGADGSIVVNDSAHYPGYAQVAVSGQSATTWASSTSDPRALQKYAAADRIASTWWAWSSFNIDVNITDGNTHQVALYCLDWDYDGRGERIDVLDAASGSVLDSRAISGFTNGVYLVWNIGGHVSFRVTLTGPGNAVVSGVFFK
jgi:uncharacterized membrane protein YwzB